MRRALTAILLALFIVITSPIRADVTVVDRPDTTKANAHYAGSKAPVFRIIRGWDATGHSD